MNVATVSVLEAEALTKHYPVSAGFLKPLATVQALEAVSFSLAAGRTLAVVGESGCGKSTLARQVTMLETPTSGRLRLAGDDIADADAAKRKALRRTVQMVFQNPFASLNPRKKIGQALEEPLAINKPLRPPTAPIGHGPCSPGWASGPSTTRAIRTCSPAASGSASPSPGR